MTQWDFDALVVGSGAGGAAAAYRLIQGGLRVALFEKGARLPRDGSTLDVQRVVHDAAFRSREAWEDGGGRTIVPEEYFNVGGKTKWYGAALLRFADAEFEADSAHACRAWPIRPREMLKYYEEAERLLGVRVFDCEPELARVVKRVATPGSGWKVDPMPMGLRPEIVDDVREASHFDGFASPRHLKAEAEANLIDQLESSGNFRLFENAEVSGLLGSPWAATRVEGVRLADGREFRAPMVFLAAGALHSPRLLQRYLFDAQLDARLPASRLVGGNLKLHLLTFMVSVSHRPVHDLIRKTSILTHDRHPHSSVQPIGFDGELIGTLVPAAVPRPLRSWLGRRAHCFFLQTEDGSHAANRVRDAGPGRKPVLDFDESRVPASVAEHRSFGRSLQAALLKAGLLSLTHRIGVTGTAHACGTLVCGTDADDSVVDSRGSVHGMQGLYVVDGSILPRSSRVNPSLTIYAWALRAAELALQARESA